MAFRLIRLFTGDDDQSHFSVGGIEWKEPEALNALSQREQAQTIFFEETAAGARLDWHNAPHRQYVITLSGRLEFEPYRRKANRRTRRYLVGRGHIGRRTSLAPGRRSTVASCLHRGKRDRPSNAKRDRSMSDDERPAEVLRGERFAML
jgi:hypothetical protein